LIDLKVLSALELSLMTLPNFLFSQACSPRDDGAVVKDNGSIAPRNLNDLFIFFDDGGPFDIDSLSTPGLTDALPRAFSGDHILARTPTLFVNTGLHSFRKDKRSLDSQTQKRLVSKKVGPHPLHSRKFPLIMYVLNQHKTSSIETF
jgi:hypothetical protein